MANSVAFVGSGKLDEIREYIEARNEDEEDEENHIGVVIFDDELSAQSEIRKQLTCLF